MRVFGITAVGMAAVGALLTGPAYAQAPNINLIPEVASKSPEQKEADEKREKAYRESLRKIPDGKVSTDPWGNVRTVDTPNKPAAAAKPRTKTGAN